MNGCESHRFGIVNEQIEKMKYTTQVPIEVRIAALNFAVECAKLNACEQTADAIISLANKAVNNYFK
jgi:hypothetical protein